MLKLEKFTGNKTYMFPNGMVATPEIIRQHFPAVDRFTHILEVNGNVCQAVQDLAAMRQLNNIDESLSEDDAIKALEVIINTLLPIIISPEERLAAAAEFQNILSLPDAKNTTTNGNDTIVKQNYKRGLWSASMVDMAVQKGIITPTQATEITTTK